MTDRANRLLMTEFAAAFILALGPAAGAGAQTNGPASASTAPATPAPDASTAPVKTIRVQVLGSVSHPGYIDVAEGQRLLSALERAGVAAPIRADLRRVVLVRADAEPGQRAPSYVIDVYQALRNGDQRYDPILRANDRIYVPELRPPYRLPLQIATSSLWAASPRTVLLAHVRLVQGRSYRRLGQDTSLSPGIARTINS